MRAKLFRDRIRVRLVTADLAEILGLSRQTIRTYFTDHKTRGQVLDPKEIGVLGFLRVVVLLLDRLGEQGIRDKLSRMEQAL